MPTAEPGTLRLDRILVSRGATSRTEAQRVIRRKQVTVDGVVMRDPSDKVSITADVRLDGVPVVDRPVLVKWHKPAGVITSVGDPWGRASLLEHQPAALAGYHPVGRLDADTTGLLLLSLDGAVTQRLLHPRRAVPRCYRATVSGGEPGPELVAALAAGVATAEGTHTAVVELIEGQVVQLVVTEGKHRMVRRMLNNAGFPVEALTRVRFGPFTLGDLPEGEWAATTPEERAQLGI